MPKREFDKNGEVRASSMDDLTLERRNAESFDWVDNNKNFYRITKSDSRGSVECCTNSAALNGDNQQILNPKRVNNRHANRGENDGKQLCPRNSFGFGATDKVSDKTISCQNAIGGNNTTIGWQASFQTVRDRLAYMLLNETLADVYFLFRNLDGTLQRVPTHKFVLSIGSPVFEAMFRFNETSSNSLGQSVTIQEIELVDVERESFEALLTYLYTDNTQTTINKDSVMSILYTAKKYAIPGLESACISFLETCLTCENAFMLLAKARFYDEERLAKQCLEIIDEDAQEALKADEFVNIDHETLCLVLKRNTLRVKELTLFNAVKRWAIEACRAEDLIPTPENQRKVLGSALNLIRFPLMNPSDFAKHVAPTKLLTAEEMVNVFVFYHSGNGQSLLPYSLCYRGLYTPEMVVNRFQRVESSWGYTGTPDRILNFTTGKLIATNESQFISDGSASTFRVMFDEPVEVLANVTYVASANLSGHESHYGSKGLRKIKLERPGRSDINWHFQYAPGSNNGTSVEDGQIPQIIFCAKHPY
uniref:BTB domain-containing protein n=1 Tax=Meloidogyne hapla TaxID=6305 RepID=A0A1I8BED2_MELHA